MEIVSGTEANRMTEARIGRHKYRMPGYGHRDMDTGIWTPGYDRRDHDRHDHERNDQPTPGGTGERGRRTRQRAGGEMGREAQAEGRHTTPDRIARENIPRGDPASTTVNGGIDTETRAATGHGQKPAPRAGDRPEISGIGADRPGWPRLRPISVTSFGSGDIIR